MRMSKTLARLRKGEAVRMCNLGHYFPAFIKHAAQHGFDCIWLDMEHRSFTTRELECLLVQSHLHDVDIMLRPPTLEKTRLYRYFEDGAAGLMIPHVNTAEKARLLVDAVKFPPLGDRGLDGAGLDGDYYLHPTEAYAAHVNAETFLVVQIETLEAVRNVEAIAAAPGVDGLFVGPGDLSLRLKHATDGLTLDAVCERVAGACTRHGKAWGLPAADEDALRLRRKQGAQLVSFGSEFTAMMRMFRESAAAFDQAGARRKGE